MSGDWKLAKPAGRRPLDEAVRRLMEQSLVANHERQFATPPERAARTAYPRDSTQAATAARHEPQCHRSRAGTSRRLVPTFSERPTQAVRSRTAGERSQRFETCTLKPKPSAQAREFVQRPNATPAQAGIERNTQAPDSEPRWLNHHRPSRSTRSRTSLARRPPADGRPA